ncbi:hypothetical protein Ocin01_12878 [Orchesella cincta]|uniref:Ig-like domain-containing protein n=1 Tax=Orchesella cincta TaxID=48709 RepID=A0A1D2MLT2_ORCCI|nr:hypothetical protein Ocin01_12878 [Orchesella cincta]
MEDKIFEKGNYPTRSFFSLGSGRRGYTPITIQRVIFSAFFERVLGLEFYLLFPHENTLKREKSGGGGAVAGSDALTTAPLDWNYPVGSISENVDMGNPRTNILADVTGLRLKHVVVPPYKMYKENTTLECPFDLGGDRLYAVKWYKDNEEFFRYVPRYRPPIHVHPVVGISVISDTPLQCMHRAACMYTHTYI